MEQLGVEVLIDQASKGLLDPELLLTPVKKLDMPTDMLDQLVSLSELTYRSGQPISPKDLQAFPILLPFLT